MKCWSTPQCGWTLKTLMLSARSQLQNVTYPMISFIWNIQNRSIGCQGLRGEEDVNKANQWVGGFILDWWKCCGNRPRWLGLNHLHIRNVLNAIELYTLKWSMINFMFCEFLPQNKNVELQEEGKKKTISPYSNSAGNLLHFNTLMFLDL